MAKSPERCRWVTLKEALRVFALAKHGTQSQRHIKPLHWYIACRLCLEGGFDPDTIVPRPPFVVRGRDSGTAHGRLLRHDPGSGGWGEQTILGGLKTKQVDVVVCQPAIGPVIAVSVKGTLNAFRNLTNRLEEAGGDCTNLHLTYPSLVYAFWSVMRANRAGRVPDNAPALLKSRGGKFAPGDVAIMPDGKPARSIIRYHLALSGLARRSGIRDDVSKYEAMALTLVQVGERNVGQIYPTFPPKEDELGFRQLFSTIYRHYDLRFVYQAPDLASSTARHGWSESSPALANWPVAEYEPRLAAEQPEDAE